GGRVARSGAARSYTLYFSPALFLRHAPRSQEAPPMSTADTVRRLLLDAAGEPLCDACLAFACSISLSEMRQVTEELVTQASFQRRDTCVSCRRTVPAVAYSAKKCAYCSRPVLPGDDAIGANGDLLHAACFRVLSSSDTIRLARKLSQQSRRLIEDARRQMREQRKRPGNEDGREARSSPD